MKDTERVKKIISFIEKLIVPSGKGEGTPFVLLPFQKAFIRDVYGPVDKNRKRIVRRAILSMGRKNGKTMLTACLALVHLVGPEAIMNGELFSAANTRKQAAKIFQYISQIVRADPELGSYLKIVDSTKRIVCFGNGSVYQAVAAEAGPNYGENPSLVIYDELAESKNDALYTAFDTSMGAREEPLFIVISTQSADPQHLLSQLIDDAKSGRNPTTICQLHEVADDVEDVFNEKEWKAANPALRDFLGISEMRDYAKKAKRMPSFESQFRNKYLNQRVNSTSPFIPRAEWEGCKGDASIEPGSEIYLGLDLSGKTDLTALIGVSNGDQDRVKSWFWKPKESLLDHEKRDRVPYPAWEKQGFIKTTPGRAIQYTYIASEIGEISRMYNIVGLAFDRYRIDDLMNAMSELGIDAYVDGKDKARADAIRMVPFGQGFVSMGPALEALEISILDRHLVHGENPCLTWNISNALSISDPAGSRKFCKQSSRFRIDGAVALAMAVGLKSRDLKGVPAVSAREGMTYEETLASLSI